MKRKHMQKSFEHRKIALERIDILFKEAKSRFSEDTNLSNRYVALARRIAMKYKVRIPSELKRRFCGHCYSYFVPSVNCRIRTKDGKLIYYCLNCRKLMKFSYK